MPGARPARKESGTLGFPVSMAGTDEAAEYVLNT